MHKIKCLAWYVKIKCKIAYQEMLRTICKDYDAHKEMHCMKVKWDSKEQMNIRKYTDQYAMRKMDRWRSLLLDAKK